MSKNLSISSTDKINLDKVFISTLLELAAEYDIQRILAVVVNTIPSLIGAKEASLFWIDSERKRVVLTASHADNQHNIGSYWYEIGQGLTGWVAKTGRPLRVSNIEDKEELRQIDPSLRWTDKYDGFRTAIKMEKDLKRAFLAVPIKIEGITMGVLRIAKTKHPNMKFSQEDEDLIVSFANNLGHIFKKGELLQRVKGFAELMQPIHFTSHEAMDKYFQWVVNFIPPMVGSRGCTIWLRDKKKNEYVLTYASSGNPLEKKIGQASYLEGEGLTGWVIRTGESLRINDVEDKEELKRIHPDLQGRGKHKEFSNFLAAPIRTATKIYGVIRMSKVVGGIPFSKDDENQLITYGNFLGASINYVNLEKSGFISVKPRWQEWYPSDNKTCFVLMPFSQPWSKNIRRVIKRAVEAQELTFHIADEETGAIVMNDIWKGICQARLVIADLSSANPNVAYEVGLSDVLGKEMILLAQNPNDVPFDFVGVRLLVYNPDRIDELEDKLSQRIKQVIDRASD